MAQREPRLGDMVMLYGRIVIVPTPESTKDMCLLRYGDGPCDCVWVSVDAPFRLLNDILPEPKPVKIKKSKTFTGLHDFVTAGNRKFSKGDRVRCHLGDEMGVNGIFIKYYKGNIDYGQPGPKCLFKPDDSNSKGSSKKGYFIVPESTLSLIVKE